MSETQPLVQFNHVGKSFDGITSVLSGFNLDIVEGEFLTLLGPSGSGKTTCLMMLAGFETITSGDILLSGRSLKKVPPYARDIGMVFQNYALFPHMTVAENLAFPLKTRKMGKSDIVRKIQKTLDVVELQEFADRYPRQLSGGQQQRAAVARALIYEPKLVLMDEPLGALDRQLRETLQYELMQIHQKLCLTIVYVTHDQGEALAMSDRVAVLKDGVLQQVESPAKLYEEPQSEFVAQFIGENNKLVGTIKNVERDQCTVKIDGCGDVISAVPIKTGPEGSRTMVSLRPESVRINPDETCTDQFDGTVLQVIHLGDHIRVRMSLLGHEDFIVKLPRNRDMPNLETGENVRVGWHFHDCRALEASAEVKGDGSLQ